MRHDTAVITLPSCRPSFPHGKKRKSAKQNPGTRLVARMYVCTYNNRVPSSLLFPTTLRPLTYVHDLLLSSPLSLIRTKSFDRLLEFFVLVLP